MPKDLISTPKKTQLSSAQFPIRWGACFAGVFISLLVFIALGALGLAIGVELMYLSIATPSTPSPMKVEILAWLVSSILVSLFVGSFVAARASGPIVTRIGRTEGLVITSLFFTGLFALGLFAWENSLQLRNFANSTGLPRIDPSVSGEMDSALEPALRGLTLTIDRETVRERLMKRIVSQNIEGAYNYLSKRSGIGYGEAKRRVDSVQAGVNQAYLIASRWAAGYVRVASLVFLTALILGSLSAMLGGALGARRNLRAPLSEYDRRAIEAEAA